MNDLIERSSVDEKTHRRLRFFARQILDALSPSNYLATNPQSLRRVMETGGESLATGIKNLTRPRPQDLKTKSRWTRALRYAWRERKSCRDLRSFLRENGGPAGCAEKFAAINPGGKYPGCIVYRYAGTGLPYLIVHKADSIGSQS